MGLCKCPKRKVTTQFCYEHRVNVCEHCVVLNHPRCIVQSYLLWLQDSDYISECFFCKQKLAQDECIRLTCYHIFHWKCMDHYARQMPDTTAPAGYRCVQCNEPIIPDPNLASPVADALRLKLSSVSWGRSGLGLPSTMFKENILSREVTAPPTDGNMVLNSIRDDVIVHIEESSVPRPEESAQIPRRNPQGTSTERAPLLDEDENKYKRRGILIAYGMDYWVKLFCFRRAFRREISGWKKVLIAIILFIGLCILLKMFNVYFPDESEFDVFANPNIHVRD